MVDAASIAKKAGILAITAMTIAAEGIDATTDAEPTKPTMPNDKPPQGPSQPFGTLGTIALAFGVGVLAAYSLDIHSHSCECGNKWWHLGALKTGDLQAHRCRRCGETQWWKSDVPSALRKDTNPFGHDAYTLPKAPKSKALASPPTRTLPALSSTSTALLAPASDDAQRSPNSSALALARVPSKDWP